MGCSAIVCTDGEKSDLLLRCVSSLSRQTYQDMEILCVSTVSALPEEIHTIANVLVERRPGVSLAKNLGIRASKHDIIVLTDDDCICEPDWAENLVNGFDDETVGCVTGGSVPTREGHWYASTSWEPQKRIYNRNDGFVPPWNMGAGNNIALRREAIFKIGLFDEELGPGARYQSAEDIDVFHRMIQAGYSVIYTPKAIVRHEPLDTHAQVKTMMTGYRTGIGAFFAKNRSLVQARRYFKRQFLRTQLRNSKNNFLRGNSKMGWAYLVGYIGALRGYYGYILAH